MADGRRWLSITGALFYLCLAIMAASLAGGLADMNAGSRTFYGFFFAACVISSGATASLFGYRACRPAGHPGGANRKLKALAAVSLLLFLYLAIAFPGAHAYAKRVKESQMNPPSSSHTLPPN